jgi:L,D-transpeptidase ErfK/SrfK
MQKYPYWEHPFTGEIVPPGTDSSLDERWIGFSTKGRSYIGFHDTSTRNSIGWAVSHGCVRMFNEDVRQLYEMVELRTPVVV